MMNTCVLQTRLSGLKGLVTLERFIKNKILREIAEWALTFVAAFLVFLLLQRFVYRSADVEGDSMAPTLRNNDKVIINLMSYIFSNPQRGDIIVFPYKGSPKDYYIKRIVGLPGDIIDLTEGEFYINGERIDDEFSYNKIQLLGDQEYPVTVPGDSYFVLGDNRNGSRDSRDTDIGFVSKGDISGKVKLRIWPLNKIGMIG